MTKFRLKPTLVSDMPYWELEERLGWCWPFYFWIYASMSRDKSMLEALVKARNGVLVPYDSAH